MAGRRVAIFFAAALAAMLARTLSARSLEADAYIQTNISAAKIVANNNRYHIDITILATDIEEMFQKSGSARVGVDMSQPGALEREIGKFVANRIEVRNNDGAACAKKIERASEDPTNDEGVLVVLSFECVSNRATYDATKFLGAQGPRAWQTITIIDGDAKWKIMVNSESPPVELSSAQ